MNSRFSLLGVELKLVLKMGLSFGYMDGISQPSVLNTPDAPPPTGQLAIDPG